MSSKNISVSVSKKETFVGIDVSKDSLDVPLLPDHQQQQFENDAKGINKLVQWIQKESPTQIVLEATGGLERPLVFELVANELQPVVVNPRQARDLAKGLGVIAKTDRVDAEVLARFASMKCLTPRELPSRETQDLSDLIQRRLQLVHMRTAEQNRQGRHNTEEVNTSIEVVLDCLKKQILDLDKKLERKIDANPDWNAKDQILQSVPGVGPKTSHTLIAAMPELGQVNRQEAASLAGLAPFNRDSGRKEGRRSIFGGRREVRSVLYMACLTAIQKEGVLRDFYRRLIASGKEFKVAITATMRKLLTILNVMLKTKTPWKQHGVVSEKK